MADVDTELLERVARWCAEAGRQAGAAEIRAALAPLSWDELLAARALLADPPPAHPLGPFALADLARGAPADVAAERERGGRYRREDDLAAPAAAAAATPSPAAAPQTKKGPRRPRAAAIIVRRARDRTPAADAPPAPLPLVDELQLPGGRAVLERLVRRRGARRAALAAELATRWRRADGAPPGEAELATLLDVHGLSRAFERRERDEVLHALRAAGGVRLRAASQLGVDVPALDAILVRLGATADAERLREERRAELRARATLTERVHLVLDDAERLADLDLLEAFETDLRARLPEHVRALRAAAEPLRSAFGASLGLASERVAAVAERFGIDLGPEDSRGRRPFRPGEGAGFERRDPRLERGPGRRPASRSTSGGARGPRSAGERPRGPASRPPADRAGNARGRSFGDRQPPGDRASSSRRPTGDRRPQSGRPTGDRRPQSGRPTGDRRPQSGRPAGDRRPQSGRPAGDRRPQSGRPAGDRRPQSGRPAGDRRPQSGRPAGDRRPQSGRPTGDRRFTGRGGDTTRASEGPTRGPVAGAPTRGAARPRPGAGRRPRTGRGPRRP